MAKGFYWLDVLSITAARQSKQWRTQKQLANTCKCKNYWKFLVKIQIQFWTFWLFIPSYRGASVLERDSYFLANFFSVIIAVCLVYNNFVTCVYAFSFSDLTPLVGWQEGHPACKNWVVGCWHGYLSGTRCRLAHGPADATATHCLLLQ